MMFLWLRYCRSLDLWVWCLVCFFKILIVMVDVFFYVVLKMFLKFLVLIFFYGIFRFFKFSVEIVFCLEDICRFFVFFLIVCKIFSDFFSVGMVDLCFLYRDCRMLSNFLMCWLMLDFLLFLFIFLI